MEVLHVIIAPTIDPVEALYINGKCLLAGDYYHDKISISIENFLKGMKFMGWDGHYTMASLSYDTIYAQEFVSMGEPLPNKVLDLSLEKFKKEEKHL